MKEARKNEWAVQVGHNVNTVNGPTDWDPPLFGTRHCGTEGGLSDWPVETQPRKVLTSFTKLLFSTDKRGKLHA